MPLSMSGGKYLYLLLAFCLLGMLYPALLAGPSGELAWRLGFWLVLVGVVPTRPTSQLYLLPHSRVSHNVLLSIVRL